MVATKGKSQSAAKKQQKTKAPAKKLTRRKRTGIKFEPTQDQRNIVMLAAAMGYSHERMLELIINPDTGKSISHTTLEQKFKSELQHGREIVLMKIAATMVSVASDRNHPKCVTAGIFLSKVWGRMRDPEPEWAEMKRLTDEGRENADRGGRIVYAELVLEDPKPATLQ